MWTVLDFVDTGQQPTPSLHRRDIAHRTVA
jgi:hypothetical protein